MSRFVAMVRTFDIQMGEADLKRIFKEIDLDKDKVVNYNDFSKSIKRRLPSQRALWERLFGMGHLETSTIDNSADIFDIKTQLTTSTDYHDKVTALHKLGQLMLQKQSLNNFYSLFSSVRNEIILSLKERISSVVRETCVVLAKLVQVRNNELYEWAVELMKELFDVARNQHDIIASSAHQCLCLFVRCMDDPDCRMINLLQEALKHKNDKIKYRAMQYVCLIIQKLRFDGGDDVRPAMWNNILSCIRMGVHVINNDVRTESLRCLAQTEMSNYVQAQEIITRLNKTARTRYDEILLQTKREDKAMEQEYFRTRPKHEKKSSGIQFASANIETTSISMDTTPSLPVHSAFDTTPFSGRSIHVPTKSNISFDTTPSPSTGVNSLPPIKPLGDLAGFLSSDEKKPAENGHHVDEDSDDDEQMENIGQLCEMYDDGKKGYLTRGEFQQILDFFCMPQEEADDALREIDPSERDKISFPEIETWFMQNRYTNENDQNWTQILHGEDESSMVNMAWRDEFTKNEQSNKGDFYRQPWHIDHQTIPDLNDNDLAQKASDYGYDVLDKTQLRIRIRLVQALLKLEEDHHTYQAHEQKLKLYVMFYLLKNSEDDSIKDEDDDVYHVYETRLEKIFEQHDPPLLQRIGDILANNVGQEHAVYLRICKHYNITEILPEYERRLPVNKDDLQPEVEAIMKKRKFDPIQGGGWRSDIFSSEDEVISISSPHPHRCGSGKVQYFLLFSQHIQCWHKPTGVQFLTFIEGKGALLVHTISEKGELFTTRVGEHDQPHLILPPDVWTAMEMENGDGYVLSYLTKFPHALSAYNEKKFPRSISDLTTRFPAHEEILKRLAES